MEAKHMIVWGDSSRKPKTEEERRELIDKLQRLIKDAWEPDSEEAKEETNATN